MRKANRNMNISQNIAKSKLLDGLRRHMCKVLVDNGLLSAVAQASSNVNLHLLPEYVVRVPYPSMSGAVRYFVPLSLKQKGKRRVYCDAGFDRTADTLYMSYLGKKDLVSVRPTPYPLKPYLDRLGDRWVITVGKPATEIKRIHGILEHLVAMQATSSRSNRPVDDSLDIPWVVFGPCNTRASHPAGCTEMLCTVQKYKA